jgi:regulator of sigma E protease
MGPKIFSRQIGETLYSLRLLPFGGFCAMEGEDAFVLAEEDYTALGDVWESYILTQSTLYKMRPDLLIAEDPKVGATPVDLEKWLRSWARERIKEGAESPDSVVPPKAKNYIQWKKGERERIERARKAAAEMNGDERLRLHPRAFTTQKVWKRVIILAAGATMNFLMGLVIILFLKMGEDVIVGTRLAGFMDGFPNAENGLVAGDEILSVNGNRTYYADDVSLFLGLPEGADGAVDIVVRRGGVRVRLYNFPLGLREYEIDGQVYIRYGLLFERLPPTIPARLKYSLYTAFNFARIVRISLVQLVTGNVALREMSGPVGIVSAIGSAGSNPQLPTVREKLAYTFTIAALIAVNLAVFNLLPLPSLDGGRIFGLLVTAVIEKLIRRRINPKYEGYIHAAGFAAIILLSIVILINDIIKLV